MTGESSPLIPPLTSDRKRKGRAEARVLAAEAIDAVLSKKAEDVVIIDVSEVSGIADFYVLCTGYSDTQVKAISEAVVQQLKERCDERPWHREGIEHMQWVLLDYVDLVVHIFLPEKRAFYSLERLWGDGASESVPNEGSSEDVEMLKTEKDS